MKISVEVGGVAVHSFADMIGQHAKEGETCPLIQRQTFFRTYPFFCDDLSGYLFSSLSVSFLINSSSANIPQIYDS